jgi:hypothetical protein
MGTLHSSTKQPFQAEKRADIAIKRLRSGQCHVGILHSEETTAGSRTNHVTQMLHLWWHLDLRNDAYDSSYHWVEVTLPLLRLKGIATRCRQVWEWKENGGTIPYGFTTPTGCINVKDGEFLFGPTSVGLTCSSFVLAVFHMTGNKLLDYSAWPSLPDDREWQEDVVSRLKNHGASPEHVEAVRNEIGSVRYRPEHVAGAAMANPLPAAYMVALQNAAEIQVELSTP